MAALKTIIPALRVDVAACLDALTLGMFLQDPFRMRLEKERAIQPDIRGLAGGVPRLWQMAEPIVAQQITLGAPARKWEMVFPVEILYPGNSGDWITAALDDIDRIYSYMVDHATTAQGVDVREPRFDRFAWAIEAIEENNWRLITVPVWAVIEVA